MRETTAKQPLALIWHLIASGSTPNGNSRASQSLKMPAVARWAWHRLRRISAGPMACRDAVS